MQKALLKEFEVAINKLPPTVPVEIIEEAKKRHAELSGNPEVTDGQIRDALVATGKKEFPYRRAYQDMVGKVSGDRLNEMVVEHVEPNVREKLKKFLDSGVTLEELVKSEMFESQFTGEERYQVQDGILDAEEHIKEETPKAIESRKAEYEKAVEMWKEKQKKMEEKIDELRALASKDEKWKEEILDKVHTIEEGWSIAERDPDLYEIEKEIEYWKGTLGEDV